MGQQYIVSGYIECFKQKNDENISVLRKFSYQNETPFPNIFSEPHTSYQCSMISFAGSFKDFDEDWLSWREKFESLLCELWVKSASVRIESELEGFFSLVNYIPSSHISENDEVKMKCDWLRMVETEDGEVLQESLII